MSRPGRTASKPARRTPVRPAAARVRPLAASKPAQARAVDQDTTVKALVLLVLIMIVLGSGFLYLQDRPGGAATAPAPIALEKK